MSYDPTIQPLSIVPLVGTTPKIYTTFWVIKSLKDQDLIADFRYYHNTSSDIMMLEFEDIQGNLYVALVRFYPDTDDVKPPIYERHSEQFQQIKALIEKDQLTTFQFRPDIYQNENGEVAFEYLLPDGQHKLDLVYHEAGQIYPITETVVPVTTKL